MKIQQKEFQIFVTVLDRIMIEKNFLCIEKNDE